MEDRVDEQLAKEKDLKVADSNAAQLAAVKTELTEMAEKGLTLIRPDVFVKSESDCAQCPIDGEVQVNLVDYLTQETLLSFFHDSCYEAIRSAVRAIFIAELRTWGSGMTRFMRSKTGERFSDQGTSLHAMIYKHANEFIIMGNFLQTPATIEGSTLSRFGDTANRFNVAWNLRRLRGSLMLVRPGSVTSPFANEWKKAHPELFVNEKVSIGNSATLILRTINGTVGEVAAASRALVAEVNKQVQVNRTETLQSFNDVQQGLTALSTRVDRVAERVDGGAAALQLATDQATAATGNMGALFAENTKLRIECAALEETVVTHTREITALTKRLRDRETDDAAMAAALAHDRKASVECASMLKRIRAELIKARIIPNQF